MSTASHVERVCADGGATCSGRAEALDRALRHASPAEVIASALRIVGREHLALVSSFGTESAALLKVMADVDPAIPVIFLDTGWLFEETLAYRDTLIAELGLRDVRSIKPLEETLSREDPDRELWFSDPDACCRIRKVEPLSAGAGAVRCLDQRPQALSGRPARRDAGGRGRRRQAEIQSVRQCLARRDRRRSTRRRNCRRIRSRRRLSLGRLHALHQPDLAGRGCARRPLARPGQDRMRHPYRRRSVRRSYRSGHASEKSPAPFTFQPRLVCNNPPTGTNYARQRLSKSVMPASTFQLGLACITADRPDFAGGLQWAA